MSPGFERIAASKEHERLFALLPYKTLYLSSVKDRHGVFAFISKDERRDLPLRKQRPSVRAQLKEGHVVDGSDDFRIVRYFHRQ